MTDGAVTVENKVVLVVIDGWGLSDATGPEAGNAVAAAATPVMDGFKDPARGFAYAALDASGLAVGLPRGLMGNSEVGHLNIGAGRPVWQDIVRIDLSIEQNTLRDNAALQAAWARARDGNGRLHFLGLVSDGGVHSHIRHLKALLDVTRDSGAVRDCFVHAFSDGRDTPPDSGAGYVGELLAHMQQSRYGRLASVTGRYYAMDRDRRWERIELAVRGLVKGEGEATTADGVVAAMQARYAAGETDEFMKPLIVDAAGSLGDGDTLVFIDFRADRMRQICETLGLGAPWDVPADLALPRDLSLTTMTEYKASFPFPTLFPKQNLDNVLAEWISRQGLLQFHTAETEKYAHVTFFFNGGVEEAFPGEERELVPSPKVATYDLDPKMSQRGVGDAVVRAMETGRYPLVVCNLAAPDMVGHTGCYEPTIEACAVCDEVIGRVWEAARRLGWQLMITSDHGNAEQMVNPESGGPFTAHTTNFVPFVLADDSGRFAFSAREGVLADVAPTLLDVMGLPSPPEFEGRSLLVRKEK